MNPLVSVIIPTIGRPQYLPRAINSALTGMESKDVEVIVVPNGPDDSWQKTLQPYHNNLSVRIIPIMEANANIARNVGLDEARGEFIRFLDDDDYLIPEGAVKQYELIKSFGVDVVSGSVQLVDESDQCFNVWHQPDMDDLCIAVLGPWRNCLPAAHVYRRSCLGSAKWNPSTIVRQDLDWLFNLCVSRELRWHKINDIVCAWQHHWNKRISSKTHFNEIRKLTIPMLIRTYNSLQTSNRLNNARKQAVALGLWSSIHSAFFLDPFYWWKIAHTTQVNFPTSRPPQALYNFPILRHIDPLIILWLILPVKWLIHLKNQILKKLHIRHN